MRSAEHNGLSILHKLFLDKRDFFTTFLTQVKTITHRTSNNNLEKTRIVKRTKFAGILANLSSRNCFHIPGHWPGKLAAYFLIRQLDSKCGQHTPTVCILLETRNIGVPANRWGGGGV